MEREYLSSIEDTLRHHTERVKDELAFQPEIRVNSFFHDLQHDFKLGGIANRLVSGNVGQMTEALILCGRVGYLLRLYGGEKYSGGFDCAHVFDLLMMLAVSDSEAIHALTNQFKAPFTKGHPDTVLLCNAVYMALDKHPSPDSVLKLIEGSKSTKFFLSMFRCLAAVNSFDDASFIIHLKELLKGNRRQDFHSGMDKAICIEAHAMANLWNIRHNSNPINLSSLELPWDMEFHKFTLNRPDIRLPGYSTIPTTLNTWIKEMPGELNINDLRSELSEDFVKKLARRIRVSRQKTKLQQELHRKNR